MAVKLVSWSQMKGTNSKVKEEAVRVFTLSEVTKLLMYLLLCITSHTSVFRWRGVRVFISSTFRDMHAERDILVRSVFPELRRRAAPHCLYLQEVELRWGVTEEESSRTTELCLSEVCRSQMLVGILGERYGLVPLRPALPDLPQYSWVRPIRKYNSSTWCPQ